VIRAATALGRSVALCAGLPPSAGEGRRRRNKAEARQRRVDELELLRSTKPLDEAKHGELTGLLSRGDTYCSSDYTEAHHAFKRVHNQVFVSLALRLGGPRARVFYLEGPDGGSTAALRAGGFTSDQLYVANPHAESCRILTEPPASLIHLTRARAETALAAPDTADVPFCAAYLDGCSGRTAPLVAMIDALFHHRRHEPLRQVGAVAIGFTLTRAEPSGRTLGDREQHVLRALTTAAKRAGFGLPLHVLDDPGHWGVPPAGKEHDNTMTTWIVCKQETVPT